MAVFTTPALAVTLKSGFSACLELAPGTGAERRLCEPSPRPAMAQGNNLQPSVVGECDDSAEMKAFGQSGTRLFFVPSVIAHQVCERYGVIEPGRVDALVEQGYAMTTERRLSHFASMAIARLRGTTSLPETVYCGGRGVVLKILPGRHC